MKTITQAGGNVPVRQLNMELMRIVAMMLVLLVHATFLSNPWPVRQMFEDDFVNTFVFSYVEALALVCVNCFILISGYFSIKPKWKSFFNLIFIIYFYKALIFTIDCCAHGFNSERLILTLYPFTDWFVGAYLGLYLLSPLINKFADNAEEKEFRWFLIVYLALQITLGWLFPSVSKIEQLQEAAFMGFNNGYSVLAFVGLYCLARYVKLHGHRTLAPLYQRLRARHFMMLFFAFALINTALFAVSRLYTGELSYYLSHLFEKYSNPFTMAASVSLMFFFIKLKVPTSTPMAPAIIVFGKSAFAVYFIHFNFFTLPYYKQAAHAIFDALPIWGWIPAIVLFVIVVYTFCVLIDQARIAAWNAIPK